MTLPSDLPLPTTESMNPVNNRRFNGFLSIPGADLVFTQDGAGQYLSFYWREAEQHGLKPEQLVGKPLEELFAPLATAPYLERLRKVLDSLIPVRLEYPFFFKNQYFVFDLTVSPILMPHGTATTAVVMGQFLRNVSRETAVELVNALVHSNFSTHSDRHQKRLTQVVWNIRRSLDLETIWQQTVDGLGEALGVSRCLICPYKPNDTQVKIVAEYRQSSLKSMLGMELSLAEQAYLSEALMTLKPISLDSIEIDPDEPLPAVLAIATTYTDEPNGLIILHQLDRSRIWNEVEIDWLREIADQLGTGIAHANLMEETRSLATELQRVNDSLRQQHQEIVEARQQAEAASRLKSEFLANTSHELRTPLNGMLGFLKLIMDGMADDPEEQNQFIQEAYRSAIHLLNIINDILDIAKIEAGKCSLTSTQSSWMTCSMMSKTLLVRKHSRKVWALRFKLRQPATRLLSTATISVFCK